MGEHTMFVGFLGVLLYCEVFVRVDAIQKPLSNRGCLYCSGFDDGICINLSSDGQTSRNLTDRCTSHISRLTADMLTAFGSEFQKSLTHATDLKCVYYMRRSYNGQDQVYQSCMSTRESEDFCLSMVLNETMYRYKLFKCVVCSNENCSGGAKLGSGRYYVGLVIIVPLVHFKYFNF